MIATWAPLTCRIVYGLNTGSSKSAVRMFGFFSTRIEIDSVFGIALDTATGTTAPFSAMSGAVIVMSLLSAELPPPSTFTVSATLLVSNAAFQSCAHASPGRMMPAATSAPSTLIPAPIFMASLRR